MLVRIHGTFTYYTARQPTYTVATADLWKSPFFLVTFHGNFTSGTAQSGSLTDVVQITQVAIPTSGRQKITYVLSNRDKLFVFDHSDPVDHSDVVFFTLSYDAGVAQRIREDF